jgi:hypothetical protein
MKERIMAKIQTGNGNTQSKWGEKLNTNPEFRKTSALEVGQSIEGTVIAFKTSKIPGTDKEVTNVVMQDERGEKFTLCPSGNLVYAIRDGYLKVGNTYRLEREGSKKIRGMTSGVFGIYPSKFNKTPDTPSPKEADTEV